MYEALKEKFSAAFGRKAEYIFSAPGRTELGGNHTDHQLGRVLAAAVSLDTRAAAAENGLGLIRVKSEGYPLCSVELSDLAPRESETGTTAALVRGVAFAAKKRGALLRGFDAVVESSVLPGSGLSSSAAFEVLMGTAINHICGCGFDAAAIALMGQEAENLHFGKPCGLMDQMASSVGGVVAIDFADGENPAVEKLDFDFDRCGHALCIIDCGADHADLTEEYAAIPAEMKAVAAFFGMEHLRALSRETFGENLPALRRAVGDRAVLRAMHFFEENERAQKQASALKNGDFEAFLNLVGESGRSSWLYLQNVVPGGAVRCQELAFALALAAEALGGKGACRVHGGGFAGTVQAFVPAEMLGEFTRRIEKVLGAEACHVLSLRKEGGTVLEVCK